MKRAFNSQRKKKQSSSGSQKSVYPQGSGGPYFKSLSTGGGFYSILNPEDFLTKGR